jgi:hypothetical protein
VSTLDVSDIRRRGRGGMDSRRSLSIYLASEANASEVERREYTNG